MIFLSCQSDIENLDWFQMETRLLKFKSFKLTTLSKNIFGRKMDQKSKKEKSDLTTKLNYIYYPRSPKRTNNKGFKKIDNGIMAGTHWTCF